MIHCQECGQENMDGLEYCDSCGAKLEAVAAEAGEEVQVAAEEDTDSQPDEGVAEAARSDEVSAENGAEAAAGGGEDDAVEAGAARVDEAADAEASVSAPEAEIIEASEVALVAEGSASLTIIRGGSVGKVFELQTGDNLIGRWDPDSGSFPEVDLENDDPEARISRKHALIKFGEELTIEDIGSLNGTFVNRGPRLDPGSPATLNDGDEVIVGKTFFKVTLAK